MILKGIRDTKIEEDLEKEMETESEKQDMIVSRVSDDHPWGGCGTAGVFGPRVENKECRTKSWEEG